MSSDILLQDEETALNQCPNDLFRSYSNMCII